MNGPNGAAVGTPGRIVEDEWAELDEGPRCLACVHLWSDHSAVDVRYCTATLAMSHERGCICDRTRSR
jgi:hypothetical protein